MSHHSLGTPPLLPPDLVTLAPRRARGGSSLITVRVKKLSIEVAARLAAMTMTLERITLVLASPVVGVVVGGARLARVLAGEKSCRERSLLLHLFGKSVKRVNHDFFLLSDAAERAARQRGGRADGDEDVRGEHGVRCHFRVGVLV